MRAGTVGREGAGRAERWRGMVVVVVVVLRLESLDCRICCCLENESEGEKEVVKGSSEKARFKIRSGTAKKIAYLIRYLLRHR